ncbi:DUF3995 domain-containing protein [Gracilibacillus saliphilus]|uniref:DUF3995 domain-containing protein n=1 Tax=Gracilibacillus saliphilus TaxID=543890 RepID=UPI0013D2EA46|nr:DUF3995 domain-containing protein [Gracilibacillus saliphilus]
MKRNFWLISLGIVWTVLFAGMSFYWAMGGLKGVRSLGGSVYEMSLNPEPSFILIVWLTGVIKLLGLILLLMLLVKWNNNIIIKILCYMTKIAGIALFLYGLLNFITISLSAIHVLDFDLDSYATFWRLVFWEPFWMLGGIFYFFSVRKS